MNAELQKEKLRQQLASMEMMVSLLPPELREKIAMAKDNLREMRKIDPIPMSIAMALVGCEGYGELIDLIDQAEKGLFR